MKNKKMKPGNKNLQDQIQELKKTENKLKVNHKKLQNEIDDKNKEINQKNNLLERIFSNTHILIAYLDNNYNFIQVNEAYAKYNNKNSNYFIGKNYFDLYPNEKYLDIFEQVVKIGEPYIIFGEYFNYNQKAEKNKIYWDWSLYPVKDKSGIVDGLILTLLDVTERIKAEIEMEKITEKLQQGKRMADLGLLASTVAHELRNPLSVILAALYNIKRKKGNAQIESQIHTIEKKIIEGEQIISNLLTYAKIKIPDLKEFNIIDLINESVDSVRQMFLNNDIKVNIIVSNAFKKNIKIDSHQIKEVFNNILLNSFQSIKNKNGIINIHLKKKDTLMEISFIDNGSGISKIDLTKVFEPFFTRKSRGTGLGLSICYEIINLHNGRIIIESKLKKGTKIIITLPYMEL